MDGKPGDETFMKTCFPCHAKSSRDLVSRITHRKVEQEGLEQR
jgi:hypothetical protein